MQLVNSGCLNMFNYMQKSWFKSFFLDSLASLDSLLYPTENELSGARNSDWNLMNYKGACRAAPGFARVCKLDGVSPIDNWPFAKELHHFAPPKKMLHVTFDRWHVTHDKWHMTQYTWHVTYDTWCGENILSKFQLSRSNGLWVMMFWRLGGKGWPNEIQGYL